MELRDGWFIKSSAQAEGDGEQLSTPGYPTAEWHPATVPTTVVAALVDDGTYPDPYVGMNLRDLPGVGYEIGANFSNLPMPDDSPFRVPWWYRTEFRQPEGGERVRLRFGGINFTANVWLNGSLVADPSRLAGTWRIHEFDVTDLIQPTNALAVEVFAPEPDDLALTFVDWNPMPPDKAMGLFRSVTVTTSGPVALRHPQVITELPSLARAELTVKVTARNTTRQPVTGTLRGRIGATEFAQEVVLAAAEEREVFFRPADFPHLIIDNPALWWPAQYGTPHLHRLELQFDIDETVSDRLSTYFGIRRFDAEIDPDGHLLFKVNGERILIRGAGWSSEMMLRYSAERFEQELAYVQDLGLNAVRLEGTLEDDSFFDITDRLGILVMPGWCCCHHWERWEDWQDDDLPIALASLHDQIRRLRNRASVFTWLNGSDFPPPAHVEQAYSEVLEELEFPNPVVSSATERPAEHSGPSGVKMRGPYEWVPPIYWYTDTQLGGPHGFATEISPGPAPPPLESLTRFLPELWPIDESWSYHCGGGPFALEVFNTALSARYGGAETVEEYARKAQVAAYESHRAMFEAFGERKYTSTGIIQWMLNDAWPSLIWHLYDVYLRPGGAYYGTKKACEPLHIQYAYDDRGVVVVNSTLQDAAKLVATARVLDLDSTEHAVRSAEVDVPADSSVEVFQVPEPAGPTPTYFVVLTLEDRDHRTVSDNVYWLSTKPETLAWEDSQWYVTPVQDYADLTALNGLPPADLQAVAEISPCEGIARVELHNPSGVLAFFVRLSVRAGGDEVLPILWDDNCVTVLPGEQREIRARFAATQARPVVEMEGWNVSRRTAE